MRVVGRPDWSSCCKGPSAGVAPSGLGLEESAVSAAGGVGVGGVPPEPVTVMGRSSTRQPLYQRDTGLVSRS